MREMGVDSSEASRCGVIYRRGEGQKGNSICVLVCVRYRIPKGKGTPFSEKKRAKGMQSGTRLAGRVVLFLVGVPCWLCIVTIMVLIKILKTVVIKWPLTTGCSTKSRKILQEFKSDWWNLI